MKCPKFRLEAVLRIRRLQERTAALAAAEAMAVAHQAEQRAHDAADEAAHSQLPTVASGAELLAVVTHTHLKAADASRARADAVARREHADAVRAEWTAAAQRMKALEQLKERHRAGVQRAADEAEARMVDDLVTRTYAARSRTEGNL